MPQFTTQNSTYIFLKICFPKGQEQKGGGNYDLLYQNSITKYENDLEHSDLVDSKLEVYQEY